MEFYKYQGTGNDFIMIDNRKLSFPDKDVTLIKKICHRRFGIGADGVILLQEDLETDFKMLYFNADGSQGTMCGNGGRCIVAFAHFLKIFDTKTTFNAVDGIHEAEIKNDTVTLKMIDVPIITKINGDYQLNTGSPHYVKYVENVEHYDVYTHGNEIRNSDTYCAEGINVNFVSMMDDDKIFVRTYERGVEDETYSCGTGVTASALTFMQNHNLKKMNIETLGGNLQVYADRHCDGFRNIWLEGDALQVFTGNITF